MITRTILGGDALTAWSVLGSVSRVDDAEMDGILEARSILEKTFGYDKRKAWPFPQIGEVSQKLKTPQSTAYDMFLGKKAVVGWRNIKDHNHPGLLLPGGAPIPFTAENRNMLMTKSREFSEFVFQKSTNASLFLLADEGEEVADPATIEKLLEEYGGADEKN